MRVPSKAHALGLLFSLAGCDLVLGIQRREYVEPQGNSCSNSLQCAVGEFCVASSCTSTPPSSSTESECQVIEPSASSIADFNWTTKHHLLGGLFRMKNKGEEPRLQAARLAVRQINDAGGIPGSDGTSAKLAFVACDYGGADGLAAGSTAEPLIKAALDFLGPELGARIIVAGTSSSATNTAIQHVMTNQLPVVLISSFSTSPTLNDFNDRLSKEDAGLLWRTAPDDSIQALVLARIIDEADGATRVGILYVEDDYGTALQEMVVDELAKLPHKISVKLAAFSANPTPSELELKVSELVAGGTKPDVLLVAGTDGLSATMAYQAVVTTGNTETFKTYVLADAAKEKDALFDPALSDDVRALVLQSLGTAPHHSRASQYMTFESQLSEAFGVAAQDYSFLAHSFDAAYLAGYALTWAQAGTEIFDGRDVAAGLASLSSGTVVKIGSSSWNTATKNLMDLMSMPRGINVDGTSGPLDFNSDGQASGPIEIWRPTANGETFEPCSICFAEGDKCDPSSCFTP